MGAFVSVDVRSFDRIGYVLGHNYGGFTRFYLQTGNAEIGGMYNLDIYPWGSNSAYYASVGVEAAMGMYNRPWSGIATENPERFETAAEIADLLREKRSVFMNLEQTPKDVARRLIDFLSGVAYASEGKIKKVAASTYIITPYSVDIQGDLIDELSNNGLYF